MDVTENGSEALISGIEQDARSEAELLIERAAGEASERRVFAAQQEASIIKEAEQKALQQAEAVRKKVLAGVEIEVKRVILRGQERVVEEVMRRVAEEFEKRAACDKQAAGGKLAAGGGYRRILLDWIVEAMVGLGTASAVLNASEAERRMMDGELLREACKRIERITGKQVELALDSEGPMRGLGVVLTDPQKRLAFNNQLKTRILRKERQIRALIHERIFEQR